MKTLKSRDERHGKNESRDERHGKNESRDERHGKNESKVMSPINRRQFLSHRLPVLALAGSALSIVACAPKDVEKSTAIQWRMRTSWQKDMPGLFEAAERLAKRIDRKSVV